MAVSRGRNKKNRHEELCRLCLNVLSNNNKMDVWKFVELINQNNFTIDVFFGEKIKLVLIRLNELTILLCVVVLEGFFSDFEKTYFLWNFFSTLVKVFPKENRN